MSYQLGGHQNPLGPSFSGESFDVTILTFINVLEKAQHPHWLSLPRRHYLVHLQRACLEKREERKR